MPQKRIKPVTVNANGVGSKNAKGPISAIWKMFPRIGMKAAVRAIAA
jgi:hypothetical protein